MAITRLSKKIGGRSTRVRRGGRTTSVRRGGRSTRVRRGGRSTRVRRGGRSRRVRRGGRSRRVRRGGFNNSEGPLSTGNPSRRTLENHEFAATHAQGLALKQKSEQRHLAKQQHLRQQRHSAKKRHRFHNQIGTRLTPGKLGRHKTHTRTSGSHQNGLNQAKHNPKQTNKKQNNNRYRGVLKNHGAPKRNVANPYSLSGPR